MLQNITKKIVLFLFAGLMSFSALSQGGMKQRVADRLYDDLAFYKAAELYSELAKKDDATPYQIRRAAECYRFVGDWTKAEKWYEKLSTNAGAKADDFYNYAQMLKSNEKYKEANKVMDKFFTMASSNSIAKAHNANKDYVAELKSKPNRYVIAIMNDDVNTKFSDFGPNYYTVEGQSQLTFASARKNMALLNKDFQWDGSHFLDVYSSQLGGDGESVEVNKFDKGVKSKYHEGPASFSNDGTKLYLTRSNYLNRKKGLDSARDNNLKLYLAEMGEDGKWGHLSEFPYNSDDYSLGHATVAADGKTMYFTSDMPGTKGLTDIWKSTFDAGKWGTPVNVKEVNTEGREMFPYISKEGVLYFSSDGHVGLGGLDVYRAVGKGESFSKPENMGFPLNTNFDDFALIINKDETEGYFSSNRITDDSYGNDDIYRFIVKEPFGPRLFVVKGCAIEDKTEAKLSETKVQLINLDTKEVIQTITTSASGCYEFLDVPEGRYKVNGSKDNYSKVSDKSFHTDDAENGLYEPANTVLKKRECGLIGLIKDKQTGKPLPGTSVVLRDKTTGGTQTFTTDANGEFSDDLANFACPGGLINYDVTVSKDGFVPKKVTFTHPITKPGIVRMEESLDIDLIPIGMDIKAMCQIEDLLYDFDKSYIRADAAVELNKLIACMKANPGMVVEIGSHTDCRASKRYNEKLSDRRAKSARKYVIKHGIAADRIFGRGYGEIILLNRCACEPTNKSDCSEEEHQLNRRTEFRVVSGGDGVKNNSTNSFRRTK